MRYRLLTGKCKVARISSRNQILTVKEKMGKEEAEKGHESILEKVKQLVSTTGNGRQASLLSLSATFSSQSESEAGDIYREREIRRNVTGLSRQKQPQTGRIFPKGLQLSCVFSLQTLMYRAPETRGSFQVSASIEKVKLGVVVKFHIVSVIRHQNEKDT